MNTEVLRNYNNKMTQLQTYVLMSRRLATTQATRRGFFFSFSIGQNLSSRDR